jgi:hypothetical protein
MTTQSHGQLPTERTPSPPSDTAQTYSPMSEPIFTEVGVEVVDTWSWI